MITPYWSVAKPVADQKLQSRLQWVADMLTASEQTADDIGVSPEAIVAQAAQESAWGASRQGNFGLFGHKAVAGWTGLKARCSTREWVIDDAATGAGHYVYEDDWFTDYASLKDCLDDHFAFLRKYPIYAAAGVFDGLGDEHYFDALQKAGYATDPKYAANLLAVRDTIVEYYLPYLRVNGVPPAPPPSDTVLHVGMSGASVRLLQDALRTQGFDPGPLDGIFGVGTRAAVKALQAAKHLDETGVLDPVTRKAAGLA